MSEIRRNPRGFYTLYIDGMFEGNYDSYAEAAKAHEEIVLGEASVKGLVGA